VLLLMFEAPEIFHARLSGEPVTDQQLYYTHCTDRYLDKSHDNADGYEIASVLPCASNLRKPLLVMRGMADHSVSPFARHQVFWQPARPERAVRRHGPSCSNDFRLHRSLSRASRERRPISTVAVHAYSALPLTKHRHGHRYTLGACLGNSAPSYAHRLRVHD
jgi:hypothetical protein